MTRVLIPSDLRRYTGGEAQVDVNARSYRELLPELCARFPGLDAKALQKMAIAIDGMVIHEPLLQRFGDNSELVFVPRIAGG